MLKIEPFELYSVVTGTVLLDGGAMFGVVPKVLWERVADPDPLNRIRLCTRTLVAVDRDRDRVVLVDSGCGTKWDPERAERYGVSYDSEAIPRCLGDAGLTVDSVTDVIVSHLHFDHNGGLTYWYDEPDGPVRLRYPGARHWIHRHQWEHARNPTAKDRASFLREDFDALAAAGVIEFVEGDSPRPPFEGAEWFVSNGHTPGQLHPTFGVGNERLMFVGDLVPTMGHLRLGWGMAYDLFPLTTIEEKGALYKRCFEDGLLLAFPHDPGEGGVAIGGTPERPIVTRTLPL
jgi:glyoxylase-like metal-dependent hydrolase (beta-lactamase superfamily II)